VSISSAIDRWVLAELAELIDTVDGALETYDVSTSTRALERFVDDLSNWYVRRNRRRFWKSVHDDPADKAAAYHTLHTCLVTLSQLLAPFIPFLSERLWQDLVVAPAGAAGTAGAAGSVDADAPHDSVHLSDFPVAEDAWRDDALRQAMATARRVVELGRQARNDSAVRIRQPLARALVSVPASERDGLKTLTHEVAEELNVHTIELSDGTGELIERDLKPNFRALGPVFQQRAPKVAEAIGALDSEEAGALAARLDGGDAELEVDGETVTITAEMVEVVERPRTGWAVARDATTTFALDTELSRELEVEGVARELVRAINDQRKAAGLELSDRIELILAIEPAELDQELADGGHYDQVARDVLATSIQRAPVADGTPVDLGELGSALVAIRP